MLHIYRITIGGNRMWKRADPFFSWLHNTYNPHWSILSFLPTCANTTLKSHIKYYGMKRTKGTLNKPFILQTNWPSSSSTFSFSFSISKKKNHYTFLWTKFTHILYFTCLYLIILHFIDIFSHNKCEKRSEEILGECRTQFFSSYSL